MSAQRPLIVGNWKMNGTRMLAQELVQAMAGLSSHMAFGNGAGQNGEGVCDIVLCPPATLIHYVHDHACKENHRGGVHVGGQDCHAHEKGAFTGDVSPLMLRDAGASYVIVGHSERRNGHGESSALVAQKAQAAQKSGLITIICVGEDKVTRQAGHALAFVEAQVRDSLPPGVIGSQTVIAYEPVWAIGSGCVPSSDEISAMHERLRQVVMSTITKQPEAVRLLYGGSVTPSNAADIMALNHVDGVLVGGASLRASDFCAIASAAQPHIPSE